MQDTTIGEPNCASILRIDSNQDSTFDLIAAREVIVLYQGHNDRGTTFTEVARLSADSTVKLGHFDISGHGLEDIVAANARDSVIILSAIP